MKTITVYSIEELSEEVKAKVIEKHRNIGLHHDWWDTTYEDAKQIGTILGFDIKKIFFSGFASQGDGACFEGGYSYKKGSCKAIRDYAPKDKELHEIADRLFDLQQPAFYRVTATIRQSGHYMHSGCTNISIYHKGKNWLPESVDAQGFKDVFRTFMDWIYSKLETDHDYITSEENIMDHLKANEYQFTEAGKMI